jgi:hypothetical protein
MRLCDRKEQRFSLLSPLIFAVMPLFSAAVFWEKSPIFQRLGLTGAAESMKTAKRTRSPRRAPEVLAAICRWPPPI